MRKAIITLSAVLLSVVLVSCKEGNAASKVNLTNVEQAQKRDKEIKVGAPEVVFDREIHDFGVVDEGFVVETSFKVTNTGKSDLVITDAKASCGCTVPTWPKEPIKPGQTSEVQVKFNTSGKPNKQSKTVTLYTNTVKGREEVKISGMVTPKKKA
ncbi:DUF1573 domain-containing protein [Tenacibaculum jejuense]|uniref:Probable lipoprotein n=1 Tax=Tenacibaculum jejuense TaxID=584609 RepID=A0A238UEJ6_9FLAO|nr:DUF1573 domain-containing protein [Tenacibaculum jejuense]SNR16894.1 Probable lipoprotein precursor [Tenacibaculum jejuense]